MALVVLIASGWAATGLKFTFFPNVDSTSSVSRFELPPGSTLAETDALARRAEEILMQDPAVEAVQSTVGGAGTAENSPVLCEAARRSSRPVATEEATAPTAWFLADAGLSPSPASAAPTPISAAAIFRSACRQLDRWQRSSQRSSSFRAAQQGLTYLNDIDTTFKPGKPELQFHLDPAKIGNLGFTNDQIASSVRALINGDTATTFRKNGKDTDVVVRLKPGDRAGIDTIRGHDRANRERQRAAEHARNVELASAARRPSAAMIGRIRS